MLSICYRRVRCRCASVSYGVIHDEYKRTIITQKINRTYITVSFICIGRISLLMAFDNKTSSVIKAYSVFEVSFILGKI